MANDVIGFSRTESLICRSKSLALAAYAIYRENIGKKPDDLE